MKQQLIKDWVQMASMNQCSIYQTVNPQGNSPEYFLKGQMMKLKFQYFGQLMEELTHWEKENPHAGKD